MKKSKSAGELSGQELNHLLKTGNTRYSKYQGGAYSSKLRWIAQKGKKGAHLQISCRCCDKKFNIYPPGKGEILIEIAGVLATQHAWRQIFLPLLGVSSGTLTPSLFVIEARGKNRSWIAAAISKKARAQKLLNLWSRQKGAKFKLIELFDTTFPLIIVESPDVGKFSFFQKVEPKVPFPHMPDVRSTIAFYEVEKEFAAKGGKDEMGSLDHAHINRKQFADIRSELF
jgi:hypothetical protein